MVGPEQQRDDPLAVEDEESREVEARALPLIWYMVGQLADELAFGQALDDEDGAAELASVCIGRLTVGAASTEVGAERGTNHRRERVPDRPALENAVKLAAWLAVRRRARRARRRCGPCPATAGALRPPFHAGLYVPCPFPQSGIGLDWIASASEERRNAEWMDGLDTNIRDDLDVLRRAIHARRLVLVVGDALPGGDDGDQEAAGDPHGFPDGLGRDVPAWSARTLRWIGLSPPGPMAEVRQSPSGVLPNAPPRRARSARAVGPRSPDQFGRPDHGLMRRPMTSNLHLVGSLRE